jgi:hypothetical protein
MVLFALNPACKNPDESSHELIHSSTTVQSVLLWMYKASSILPGST